MNHLAKRMLAALLALGLTAGLLPTGVSAHTEDQEIAADVVVEEHIAAEAEAEEEIVTDAVAEEESEVLEPMTQSRTGGFKSGYKLTGNGAEDMVAIALAQEGRTGRQFGYTEAWCANFVSDCAILAGQSGAIPQYGSVSGLKKQIMDAGGRITTKNPKPGDICFIDWDKRGGYDHVEIVYAVSGSAVYTIGGNSGSAGNLHSRYVKKHDPINSACITCIVRPDYSAADPQMWVENSNMQETLVWKTGFDLTGDICSNNGVKEFTLAICDQGSKTVQTARKKISDYPYQNAYSLDDLAGSLDFSGLDLGSYTLVVKSYDKDDTSFSAYTKEFTVVCEHEYSADVLDPTCTEPGQTTHVCANCGDSYVDSHTEALGHDYESIVTEPTCTAGGRITHTCTACGDSYMETLEALGHGWEGADCIRCDVARVAQFNDVLTGHFYAEPVRWAVENAITNGTSETIFDPASDCNRAAVVTFLWRCAGEPEPEATEHPFVDVQPGSFYEKAVLWALETGVTNGMDAAHFGPTEPCNRAQVVTFLHRAQEDLTATAAECPFTDVAAGAWYEAPVLWAVEHGVTNGMTSDTFGVEEISNRAQVVTFLYRAYVN